MAKKNPWDNSIVEEEAAGSPVETIPTESVAVAVDVTEVAEISETEEVSNETPEATVEESTETKADEVLEGELMDMVIVTVPQQFTLNLDHNSQVTYKAGVQKMERAHAEHWFSKAQGVTVFEG